MKKIVVAGCGHGGLVAAAKLSQAGYDVTVYEKKKREELGHDWEDRFTFSLLAKATEKDSIPRDIWRYRGDCAFVSPSFGTKVVVRYEEDNRQKVMWRKPILEMLLTFAEEQGVRFVFSTEITGAMVKGNVVEGITTANGEVKADLVIDACGVFSPVRRSLPDETGIEREPNEGDVFYAYRAYFDRVQGEETDIPFEVYLCHEGEPGLSWHLINDDSVDVLIGRTYPLTAEKVEKELEAFRLRHPCTGKTILRGGTYGVIPVRRALPKMVTNGYAAVGDSAFMTTPMNGMGLDLSLQAGELLAETVIKRGSAAVDDLWEYNHLYHQKFADVAKNEGLKNALLSLPEGGVDFLFENGVIQSSDLAGAGRNTNIGALLGKFVRGMKRPKFFFAIIKGLIKGGKNASLYRNVPVEYNEKAIENWSRKISKNVVKV